MSKNTTIDYYNTNAQKWANSHSDRNFWGEHMHNFFELLPKGKILEIGCGAGRDARELIEFGYDYVGIEPSEKLLEIAQKNNPTGEFINKLVEELDFDNEFDGFWASASLLHIPKENIDNALQHINKALKPGAIGFISLKKFVQGDSDERLEIEDEGSRLFSYWTMETFSEVLKRNGFELAIEAIERPMSEKTVWLIFLVSKFESK